jgi:hypothetical protein
MKQKRGIQGILVQRTLVAVALAFGLAGGAWAHAPKYCGPNVSRQGKVITVKPKPKLYRCEDNTANLQCAIDLAVKAGRGSVVQLTQGEFCTAQLVATNFKGTIRGEGMKKTILQNLPNLVVKKDDYGFSSPTPPSGDNPWASLLTFVNGEIAVRDLAIQIVGPEPTTGWHEGGLEIKALVAALYVAGTRADLRVSRISVSGESFPPGILNLFNAVLMQGGFTQPTPLPPLVGLYEVRDSRFRTVGSATAATTLKNSEVVVENNTFDGALWAGEFAGVSNTSVRFVNNEVSADVFAYGIQVRDFLLFPPNGFTDSRLLIAHNKFKGVAFGAAVGIMATFGGKNTCLVVLNDTGGVKPTAPPLPPPPQDWRPIFLGDQTSNCLVVTRDTREGGAVNDQGTNNRVIAVPWR